MYHSKDNLRTITEAVKIWFQDKHSNCTVNVRELTTWSFSLDKRDTSQKKKSIYMQQHQRSQLLHLTHIVLRNFNLSLPEKNCLVHFKQDVFSIMGDAFVKWHAKHQQSVQNVSECLNCVQSAAPVLWNLISVQICTRVFWACQANQRT